MGACCGGGRPVTVGGPGDTGPAGGSAMTSILNHTRRIFTLLLSLLLQLEYLLLLLLPHHKPCDSFCGPPDEPDMSQLEQAVSKRMCGVGIIIFGLLLLSVALIMGLEFPKFVYQKNLKDVCILDTNHRLYEHWRKDVFRDKSNRLYYWELTNKDDFLYAGALPIVRERGPYVYRETERKQDVRFSYSSVDFYLRRWQHFDDERTKAECGENCTQHDQITILNPHYFSEVGKYGSDVNYALLSVPEVVDTLVTEVALLTNTNMTGTMALFGRMSDATLDDLTADLGYPSSFRAHGFGSWLGLRDTAYKTVVHNHRGWQDFTAKEMSGLFAVIRSATFLGASPDLLSRTAYVTECDVNANPFRFLSLGGQDFGVGGVLQYDTKPPACSFLACLARYITLQQAAVAARHVTNVTDCIARYLCISNATACFSLPVNPYYQNAYIFAIHEYLTTHWTRYALYRQVVSQNRGLVTTRPQSELALGYHLVNLTEDLDADPREYFVPGILEHTDLAADVRWKSKKITMYNCYDTVEAQTNFFWKGYDGQVVIPEDQFPNASSLERRVYSHRRNVPPTKDLVACEDPLLTDDSYDFFIPAYWRKLEFWTQGIKLVGDIVVSVVGVNQSIFDVDYVYVNEPGLQSMDRKYGYLSWLSLPHFLYANSTGLAEQFNMMPSVERHSLQMGVEPVTGSVWESAIRHQLNVGLRPQYVSVGRPRPLLLAAVGRPLPVYWLDESFTYNQAGRAEFEDRSGRLLRAACGGLIGMGFLSGLAVLIGIMAATIRIRSGRVAPAPVVDGL